MPKQILLADDSVTIGKIVEITFAHEDFVVTAVRSGDEALARARANPPDLVLADAGMPGKTGYDVCAELRSSGIQVPVLILTGNFSPYDDARGKTAGADGNVVKPFETQALVDRVNLLIAQRGSTSAPHAARPAEAAPAAQAPAKAPATPPSAVPPSMAAPRVTPTPRAVSSAPRSTIMGLPTFAGPTSPGALAATPAVTAGGYKMPAPHPTFTGPSAANLAPPPPKNEAPATVLEAPAVPETDMTLRGPPPRTIPTMPSAPASSAQAHPPAPPAKPPARPRQPTPAVQHAVPPVAPPRPVPSREPSGPATQIDSITPIPGAIPPPVIPVSPPPVHAAAAPPPVAAAPSKPIAAPRPAATPVATIGHTDVTAKLAPDQPAARAAISPDAPRMPRPSLIPNAPSPQARTVAPAIVAAVAAVAHEAAPRVAEALGGAASARGAEYDAIVKMTREVIEQIAWEVVPELAETIIRAELDRLVKERAST